MNEINVKPELIDKLKEAKRIVFFTGAGISAESGISTFRGKDGIWNKLSPQELASFDAFMKNPQLVWEWYNHRKQIIHSSKPNPGHICIAQMEDIFEEVTVITQNIDNLHKRAGSKKIYELHGNIERNFCVKCKTFLEEEPDFSEGVPLCQCGGLIRPDVVWFGEYLPEAEYTGSELAARNSDLFFVVGTSAIVYPAAGLIHIAKQSGAYIVEINIEPTSISDFADVSLFGTAGKVLSEILNKLKE